MLIVLFVFEIIIVGLTIFTTHMVEHKFKMIEMSLAMYCNKRTYKTKANIDFIENIMNTYQKLALDSDEEPDLESAIRRKLQHEYIGRFPYISVKNMAIKARHLMWAILGLEFIIAWINKESYSGQMVILITTSLLLTIIMEFYGIIRGLDEKSEALIDEVIHYVRNVYPIEQGNTISVVPPKQSTTISLEEHKVKRGSLKASEKQMIRDHNYESKNCETQKLALHKEKSMKKLDIRSHEANECDNGQESEGEARTSIKASSIQQEIDMVIDNKEMCGQVGEKQHAKKDTMELSARDIAKLLEHL